MYPRGRSGAAVPTETEMADPSLWETIHSVTALQPLVVYVNIVLCPSFVKDPVLEFFGVNKRLVLFIKKKIKRHRNKYDGALTGQRWDIKSIKKKKAIY